MHDSVWVLTHWNALGAKHAPRGGGRGGSCNGCYCHAAMVPCNVTAAHACHTQRLELSVDEAAGLACCSDVGVLGPAVGLLCGTALVLHLRAKKAVGGARRLCCTLVRYVGCEPLVVMCHARDLRVISYAAVLHNGCCCYHICTRAVTCMP